MAGVAARAPVRGRARPWRRIRGRPARDRDSLRARNRPHNISLGKRKRSLSPPMMSATFFCAVSAAADAAVSAAASAVGAAAAALDIARQQARQA